MYEENSNEAELGRYGENLVLDWLGSLGYRAKIYMKGSGRAQIKRFVGDKNTYRYPDIEVFMNENCLDIKFLVEVKTLEEPYLEVEYYKLMKRGENVDSNLGVAIKLENFLDYLKLHDKYGFVVRVVFVVKSTGNWYWQNIEELNETKSYNENLFGKGKHYFWRFSKLRTDFKGR